MTAQEANAISVSIDDLISEVERYLAAVDVFRREGCEPRWSTNEGLPVEALVGSVDAFREQAGVS